MSEKKATEKQKRHTHQTAAGVEDALAVLNEIVLDLDTLRLRAAQAGLSGDVILKLEALTRMTDYARDILKKVRSGPYAYDPERPSGLHLTIKRRD